MDKVFIPRLVEPQKDNKFFYSDANPYVKKGYGLPNCTCYACGRFAEIHGEFVPELGYGNAEDWYARSPKLEKGSEPKVGAIICWQKGKAAYQKDGAGHVAIVEEVDKDGNIRVSASNYSGKLFYMKSYKKSNKYSIGSEYTFQGFIYPKYNIVMPELAPFKEREKSTFQLFVYWNNVRFRQEPSLSGYIFGYAPIGYYNILEKKTADGYDWYKVTDAKKDGFNSWIAYSEDWAKLCPAVNDDYIKELEAKIEAQGILIESFRYENGLLKDNIAQLKAKVDDYKSRLTAINEQSAI